MRPVDPVPHALDRGVPATSSWDLERGARIVGAGEVRFSVWAPLVQRIDVRLADGSERAMERSAEGVFETTMRGIAAEADYFYRLDGRNDRPDPVSRFQPHGVHGPSRIVDPSVFHWSDPHWRGIDMADLAIYELHVGTFTESGTFEAAIQRLAALRELGITAIELMPVAEFPGGRNWGYDGVHPYAPQSTYGGPRGLRRLVDAAHAEGVAVLLDVVYNHLGPEGNYLAEFGPYFTDRYRTPWGVALNYDGPDSDEVRRYFIDNARYWVREFHVDGLRLDAVHAIYDFGAIHLLEEIAEAVRQEAALAGRRAVVIAESDLNDPRLVRRRSQGGYALDGQWSDDFHHAVHAALTGERSGYYVDFGGIDPLCRALRDRYAIAGRKSVFRRRRHGAPAADVPADRFVVFVQNHDQIGNRALGERLSTLVPFAAQKIAAALVLASPYVPLLFMGEEYGETRPFLYFVSHGDPALVEAVRKGRREEFRAFVESASGGWGGDVPDPHAEATFGASKIDWTARERSPQRELLALHRDLLQIRRELAALRPGAADTFVFEEDGAPWIGVRYSLSGEPAVLALFNVSSSPTTVRSAPLGPWHLRLSTESSAYGGAGHDRRLAEPDTFALAAYEAALYESD
jgi:maltooligosyltrehalose trehalohydrolase